MKQLPPAIIDFHVHLFPDKGFDAIWAYFKNHGAEVRYKYYTPQCIDYLTGQDVGTIVYSNYAHKKGVAGPMNEWNLALLDQHPNLYCFAAYHPEDGDALDYAARMLAHPRVAGIKLHFMVQRLFAHDERLYPMYEMIMEKNKRLLLHVGNGPMGNAFVGIDQFKKVLQRYPDLPANIPHMGGYEFKAFMELLDQHPRLYLDTAYSFWPGLPFTFNLSSDYLEKHRHRILYGSDFPNVILPREGEINYLLGLDLSEEFYRLVFHGNGRRLLQESCPTD
ncbi:MAG: amidohydrolase family protein [Desulfobacteraceae bacterium]|nr:amidohydrolase family protein [Desulfobacteraceae bacterium]